MTKSPTPTELETLWNHHHGEYRDPLNVISQWQNPKQSDPKLLKYSVHGAWWDILSETGQTLIVTREYEHLVLALCVVNGKPRISYLVLPHPNGLALDQRGHRLFIASTRNPNMIFEFRPCRHFIERSAV